MSEYSDYIVLGIGVLLAVIAWALKKEHSRIENVEDDISDVNDRLTKAIVEIGNNNVADREWRKRVEENHQGLLKADEDRRGDARKIYDKIGKLETETHKEIQRLAEKIAQKKYSLDSEHTANLTQRDRRSMTLVFSVWPRPSTPRCFPPAFFNGLTMPG